MYPMLEIHFRHYQINGFPQSHTCVDLMLTLTVLDVAAFEHIPLVLSFVLKPLNFTALKLQYHDTIL